jgi:hypothetical protein
MPSPRSIVGLPCRRHRSPPPTTFSSACKASTSSVDVVYRNMPTRCSLKLSCEALSFAKEHGICYCVLTEPWDQEAAGHRRRGSSWQPRASEVSRSRCRPADTRHRARAPPQRRPARATQLRRAARRPRTTTQSPSARAYLARSGPNVLDPPTVGVSFTVPPGRRFRCTPWLAGAPPRRPASLGRLPMSCRASPRPRATRASGRRSHHELPARRARDVMSSSTPLMADPALLEGLHSAGLDAED